VLTDGTVKILDFGIARMTGEVSRLTQNGYLVGTPLYMSPEQLQGSDADALGDVWAYGVLYFELLTGQHPFLSQDNTRLIRNITIVNPPSVHALTRGIPEGVAQVIRRALMKDRRRRYQSLEDVLVDTNPILGLLQREQTAGLVTEAQYYRNSGQLIAARRSSRRALEIDPSNYGAQQLLKSIQHEMQEESLAEPHVEPVPVAKAQVIEKAPEPIAPPPPPAPAPVFVAPPMAPPVPVLPQDEPEMILPEREPEPVAAILPEPVVAVPAAAPLVAAAAVAVGVPVAAQMAAAVETPAPTNPTRSRPAMASGAAAAIAAAVAAAKARQAEEEEQEKEKQPEREEVSAPVIKATPLVVSALPTTRLAPPPPPTGSFRRPENGSGLFVTEDPLVVKRPAAAVMTQRMNAAESTAAVATPTPAPPPPTRLPGTRAIPPSTQRIANGTAETKAPAPLPPQVDRRAPSENLPMRRPPSEVYAKGKRRKSSSLFAETKPGKPFPWALVIFGMALASVAGALIFFSWSAPKYASAPALLPEKMVFAWKPLTAFPPDQLLTLKGGPVNASYIAASDEDWLVVTPEGDEAGNRTWQIKVEPDKVGTNGPSTNTGWIDVTSAEGFKTQAEVTLKIGAMEAAPSVKSKNTPSTPKANQTPASVTSVTPATTKPLATVTMGNSAADSAKTVVAKPAAKKPETSTKKPADDGNDIN